MVILQTLFLVALGLAPSIIWLVFYLREDVRHPEPKRLLLYVFVIGAVVTVIVLQLQLMLHNWFTAWRIPMYGPVAFTALAVIEEVFKFIAVYLVIRHRKEFDEPIDAMIYMIVGALGFAAVENIASVFQANDGFFPTPGPLETTVLRFMGATLLHTLTSGFVGYEWGHALAQRLRPATHIAIGIIGATLLHAIFNYLIITSGPVALPLLLVVFMAPFILEDFERLKKYSV